MIPGPQSDSVFFFLRTGQVLDDSDILLTGRLRG